MVGDGQGGIVVIEKQPPPAFKLRQESSLSPRRMCGVRGRVETNPFHFSWQRGSFVQRKITRIRERPSFVQRWCPFWEVG